MKKLEVGIDIADTIIDVWPLLMKKAEIFNEMHSNNEKSSEKYLYLPEDIYNWNNEEKCEFWETYRDELTFNVPIRKNVQETLKFFRDNDIGINLITAKTNDQYVDLEKKLIQLLGKYNLPYDKIYTQVINKGLLCKEKRISFLIDDSYTNCLNVVRYGNIGLLINQPYNFGRNIEEGIYRLEDISESKKIILKKKR